VFDCHRQHASVNEMVFSMSHPEQSRFIRLIRDLHSEFLVGARILDVGSYDVDGNS
jgi:hypothetical protein